MNDSQNPTTSTENVLVIKRVLDAPRALVWRAWTETDHLMQWHCCKDFQMVFVESDLRPGGAWRSGMRSPDGREYVSHGVYEQIDEPRRLVFTFAWEQNDLEPPGLATRVTVIFEERDGKTEMTFEQAGLPTPASRDSHRGGWSEAFDHLVQHLSRALEKTT